MIKILLKVILLSALAVFFCRFTSFAQKVFAEDGQALIISEVYYNPSPTDDTGLEWVKIYNPNETPTNIGGYDLFAGKYYTFKSLEIGAKGYLTVHLNKVGTDVSGEVFTGTENQTNMNDTSGSVALFNSNTHSKSTIIDFVQYGSGGKTWQTAAVEAKIWTQDDFVAKTDVGYAMVLTDVENSSNKSTDWKSTQIDIILDAKEEQNEFQNNEDEIFTLSIEEARNTENGGLVRIQGVVTVIPSKLSDQYFYVEDLSGGIQVYCYKKDFPSLSIGDLVEITGEISSYYSDKRIKIENSGDILLIQAAEPIAPKDLKIAEISDSVVGALVVVEGQVSKTSGDTFYLEENGSEIKISIKEQTAINKPRMAVGDKVRIIGVVAKYKNTYQVLPFEQAGVTILTSGKLPVGGKSDPDFSKSLLILSLWKLSPQAKKRLKNLLKTLPKV